VTIETKMSQQKMTEMSQGRKTDRNRTQSSRVATESNSYVGHAGLRRQHIYRKLQHRCKNSVLEGLRKQL